MNAIRKAITDVSFRIPRQILEKAFLNRSVEWRQTSQTSVDDQILNNVIRARVLVDCNLIGGTQAVIPLEGLNQQRPDGYSSVIHIPKNRTQGRTINSVLHVAFLSQGNFAGRMGAGFGGSSPGMGNGSESSALAGAMQGIVAAFDKIPMTSTSKVQLIAENTILVRDSINIAPNTYLRCILANDDELSHIQLRSYRAFAQLVEYAVKSYIYNELIVSLDQGELQGGQSLGIFKEIIQS
jgi:hypothetical protein